MEMEMRKMKVNMCEGMMADFAKMLEDRLAPAFEMLGKHDHRLDGSERRLAESEHRISEMEDGVGPMTSKLADLEKSVQLLTERVDDLENRGHRKNVRILGLPEDVEGTNPTLFFERWLPEVLQIKTKAGRVKLERAHCTLGPKPPTSQRPRPVLVRFHSYQDKQRVMNASGELGQKGKAIKHGDSQIMFFQDLSAAIVRKRKQYDAVKRRLRSLGADYKQLYPGLLKITFRGSNKVCSTPEETERHADTLEAPPPT